MLAITFSFEMPKWHLRRPSQPLNSCVFTGMSRITEFERIENRVCRNVAGMRLILIQF